MRFAILLLVVACGHAHPTAESPRNDSTAKSDRPPPPPPPPPARPESLPPPREIADFVRAHEHDPGIWRVQFHEELNGTTRAALLSRPDGVDLVDDLMRFGSYVTGEYGCASDTLQIVITRGTAQLVLGYNCGHLALTPAGFDGPRITTSSEVVSRIDRLRALVLP